METPADYIKQLGDSLNFNETVTTYCPYCKAEHEKKFSVTKKSEGLVYCCFRAKCQQKGIITYSGVQPFVQATHKPVKTRPLTLELSDLTEKELTLLAHKYELSESTIAKEGWKLAAAEQRLVMPTNDFWGHQWGWLAKSLIGQSPKALMFFDVEPEVKLHFPRQFDPLSKSVVLVEDIISATKLCSIGIPAVSILGTSVRQPMVESLSTHFTKLTLFLDNNALLISLKIQAANQLLFKEPINIIVCETDPKDTPTDLLLELLC